MTAPWSRGSEWHRWDPHIHTPGTALNDQFGDDWDGYLRVIETASPTVPALGIADYCSIEGYKAFKGQQAKGRAGDVRLVFPNVEFRLEVQTAKKKGLNLHLLFSPDDPDHVGQVERILGALTFEYCGRQYSCSTGDLEALGKAIDPKQTNAAAAFRKGVEQFKLDLKQLKHLFRQERWLKENCLVAISVSPNDGTSGLQQDGAFKALREEIEAFADIIFSSWESDREFWLGYKKGSNREAIERKYGSLKPCLHGSDAHAIATVLKPTDERFCWIHAGLSFEGLRQTLLEPESRVAIGPQPPPGPAASECITGLFVTQAPWLTTPQVELNSGLVAIIGPKGSGKTALADLVALAADATIDGEASFLAKAQKLLGKGQANLRWANGSVGESRRLSELHPPETTSAVRYLSQQFVERLCSADGVATELLAEMEDVVFRSIPEEDRLDTGNFAELRDLELREVHSARQELLGTIEALTLKIAAEDRKKESLPTLKAKQAESRSRLAKYEKDLKELVPKDKQKEVAELVRLQEACARREKDIQALRLRLTKLAQFTDAFGRLQERWRRDVAELHDNYPDLGLAAVERKLFFPSVAVAAGDAVKRVKAEIQQQVEIATNGDRKVVKTAATYDGISLADLRDKTKKLAAAIGVETERAKKHQALQKLIEAQKAEDARLKKEIEDAENSDGRRKAAVSERRNAYVGVFRQYSKEQEVLERLYAPLAARLDGGAAPRRLAFHVERRVDIDAWVERGEELLDLRKDPFHGRGGLAAAAKDKLAPAWYAGDPDAVAAAMDEFIKNHMPSMMVSRAARVEMQELGRWLFSTDHIQLAYGIEYDGVDITTLSPGMRGIVLLMLYLAVDEWDLRPLIVDQPEENLDPQSVYEELVGYFRQAKKRRQVILVTHNPNLVVNADADQVIVAHSKRDGKGLPTISYSSGGLEDKETRNDVCLILEGGERAFREREQRYSFVSPRPAPS